MYSHLFLSLFICFISGSVVLYLWDQRQNTRNNGKITENMYLLRSVAGFSTVVKNLMCIPPEIKRSLNHCLYLRTDGLRKHAHCIVRLVPDKKCIHMFS